MYALIVAFLLTITLSAPLCLQAQAIIVGIAGGTGSGKTTLAEKLQEGLQRDSILISQDSYYRDLHTLSLEERAQVNFDHPDALDFDLLRQHLLALKEGKAIEQPIYSFITHARGPHTARISAAQVIIVEGILIFAVPKIRELCDFKIFVDTDDDIRLLRRIDRDLNERERDFAGVRDQYLATVKPMHDVFVEPSKAYADVIVPHGGHNTVALSMILSKLKAEIQAKEAEHLASSH